MHSNATYTILTKWSVALLACAVLTSVFALPTHAHGGEDHASTTASHNTCMSAAIDVREDALVAAWKSYSGDIETALIKRGDALHTAWEKTTIKDRTIAVVKAWKEWRTEKKKITGEFRADRKAAWDAFKKTAKDSCKMKTPKEEAQDTAEKDTIAL